METKRIIKTNDIESLIQANVLWDHLHLHYDDLLDDLLIRFKPRSEATVTSSFRESDGHIALLLGLEDREFIGLRVSAVEHSFLSQHKDTHELWRSLNAKAILSQRNDSIDFQKFIPLVIGIFDVFFQEMESINFQHSIPQIQSVA